jgi:hypothetical protein
MQMKLVTEPGVFRENPWIKGLYISNVVLWGLAFWGPFASIGPFASMGSWRPLWGVAFVLPFVIISIEAFTRKVTFAEGWITVQTFGKADRMKFEDMAHWKPWRQGWAVGFIIWSKSGNKLFIRPFIERPAELDRILLAIASDGSE